MQSKKRRWSLKGFFSAVGGGVFRIGESVQKVRTSGKGSKPPRRSYEPAEKAHDSRSLTVLREEDLTVEKEPLEELEEEKFEVRRLPSERLSAVFFRLFKRPAQRFAKFFKGLDHDLYRANIKITPESYAAMMMGISIFATAFALLFLVVSNAPYLVVFLGGGLAFVLSLFLARTHPKRRAKARVFEVNKLLPYALRHMGTQLSSGIGLPETMTSVSRADYGALSEEFSRVIRDMNAGMGFEEALSGMDKRVESEPLRRATRQIQRALRTGGDLAKTLNSLAEETAFELRMKLRDYTQSLNMFTMIYMFASAVIPAMLMVTINISSSGGRAGLSPQAAGIIYLILLPFMLFYFMIMIKKLEPRL